MSTKLTHSDEIFIRRCLQLAANAAGLTFPNPVVGCVIVYNDKIIGEGWHKKAGEAHAEVAAIQNVVDKSLLKKATVYVSLEPCSHFGKTPPCVDLLIQHQIKKVVVGTLDPNPLVAGKGIAKLKAAGIDVIVGCLELSCQISNKRFFTFHKKKRPYIVLKWAESADGFMAPLPEIRTKNTVFWLSDSFSQQIVHQLRSHEHGILIGAKTLIDDNPKLNVRHWFGTDPMPFVLATPESIPKRHFLSINKRINYLYNKDKKKLTTGDIITSLHKKNIQSVLIEGGLNVLQQFIEANLWDEIYNFRTPRSLKAGIEAPSISQQPDQKIKLMKDTLFYFKNKAAELDTNHQDNASAYL